MEEAPFLHGACSYGHHTPGGRASPTVPVHLPTRRPRGARPALGWKGRVGSGARQAGPRSPPAVTVATVFSTPGPAGHRPSRLLPGSLRGSTAPVRPPPRAAGGGARGIRAAPSFPEAPAPQPFRSLRGRLRFPRSAPRVTTCSCPPSVPAVKRSRCPGAFAPSASPTTTGRVQLPRPAARALLEGNFSVQAELAFFFVLPKLYGFTGR